MSAETWDPFGETPMEPGDKPDGYTILHGHGADDDATEEAQGRRAAWHLRRIRQASRLAATKRGVLLADVEALEGELADAKRKLATLDQWEAAQCNVDRSLLASWLADAPQFHDPGRPRRKVLDFTGGIALESKLKTTQPKLTVVEEDALARRYPQFVDAVPKLRWGDLKKTLRVQGSAAFDAEGNPVAGVLVEPGGSVEQFFALVDGKRIALTGGGFDGNGDDTDGDGAGADWDPFGDGIGDAGTGLDF